ncbi:MAG: ABC transporter permease [Methylococcales bacterium]|nr:ABC transporter permease [Methylococcales bacterium]
MNNIETIPLTNLAYSLIPVLIVLLIFIKWKIKITHTLYAMSRMLLQLLVIGFFLNTIFESDSALITLTILIIMLLFSSWIALNSIKEQRKEFFSKASLALFLGSGITLAIVVIAVLELNPWYQPRYVIPLGGMVLANAMNSISLAAERFQAEISNNKNIIKARNIAFNASLIPTINMLFAVGLVSLPGMMTGQILSGISPFIAARYQIMVMCMLFASSGISAACFLSLINNQYRSS